MTSETVTEAECEKMRELYTPKGGFSPLVEEFGFDRSTLRLHLYGDCEHDVNADPIIPPSDQQVIAEECQSMREQVQEGVTVAALAEEMNRYRGTIVRHVTGECSHSVPGPTIDQEDTYSRDIVSADRCRDLREQFHESDDANVLEFAGSVEESYQVVRQHLNGYCAHDISVPPRESVRYASEISETECRAMRKAWRDDPDMTFEMMADRFKNARGTIEKHIKFHCSHDSEELLVDEMSIFESDVDDS